MLHQPIRVRLVLGTLLALTSLLLLSSKSLAEAPSAQPADLQPAATPPETKITKLPIAAIVSEYRKNSHADMIVGRFLQTATLDGRGRTYPLEVVSVYTDQIPENDTSRALAEQYDFELTNTVREALTLGGDKLAVKGILLVAEHGDYPRSNTGNIQYPKRRLFESVVEVFKDTGQVVPVFIDKHISDNWEDIQWMIQAANELNIPLMAGSSLPVSWREPAVDVDRNRPLDEIIILSYHTLDAYGFHAIEQAQALAERRPGGESGIKSVQTITGDKVWEAFESPKWDSRLFDLTFERLPKHRLRGRELKDAVRDPSIMIINYEDGLTTYIFTLNGVVGNWTAGWKYKDGECEATYIALQDGRPYYHFALLADAITQMFLTGKPTYPVERTILTSAALDALLISKLNDGRITPTPYLKINYNTDWNWKQPAPAPPIQPRTVK